ncbi:MAG: FAD-dependent oxidoreductase [Synergistaceae bacterium]|nr:FAD-dependent oxidoreductase [Synergistaceae bacterium]
MYKKFSALFLCLVLTPSASFAHDIIIAGGGMSGISAAIQATRLGASVLVVEPTNMLGGQATAAGVSTMDDMTRLRESGIYREFMDKVRQHYAGLRKSIATSYWKTDGKAFEPKVGSDILKVMAASVDIMYHSEIVAVRSADKGRSVTVKSPGGTKDFTCTILIDATEYGDIIPLAGLRYRSGNSISPDMNPASMIQDITWTAVIRKYPQGVPDNLRPKSPLPGYDKARKNYLAYVSRNTFGAGNRSPFKLPAEFSAHNGYRAIPDSQSPGSYTGARKDWKRITKTGVNWGNDYPGQYGWDEKYGLPIAYLESPDFRADINREALIKTLHFIWYIQHELEESWSVDENEYDDLPEAARDLPEEWQNIARHMPPIPYVRESRRIVGDYTYNSHEIYTNSESYRNGKKNQELTDSIAIGGYILDLHTGDDDDDFEHELGERQSAMRTHEPSGAFQVPMRIFIPASDDSFLAAEKNLSMSRLATSALRLQPVCMMTGQAVGTLAALSVENHMRPRDVHPVYVQKVLADFGVMMSLAEYVDVPEGSEYYGAVQIATLYRLVEPERYPVYPKQRISTPSKNKRKPGKFGVDKKITDKEFAEMVRRAEAAMNGDNAGAAEGTRLPSTVATTSSDNADSPAETQPPSAYRSITAQYREGMTRGEAVRAVVEAMASLPDTEAAEH